METYKEEVKYIKYHPGYTPPTIRQMNILDAMFELDKHGYSCKKVFDNREKGYRLMQFEKPNCKTSVEVTAYYA